MINKFEEGKYYKVVADKLNSNSGIEDMDMMLDGVPRKCLDNSTMNTVFEGIKGCWGWAADMGLFEEVDMSDNCEVEPREFSEGIPPVPTVERLVSEVEADRVIDNENIAKKTLRTAMDDVISAEKNLKNKKKLLEELKEMSVQEIVDTGLNNRHWNSHDHISYSDSRRIG